MAGPAHRETAGRVTGAHARATVGEMAEGDIVAVMCLGCGRTTPARVVPDACFRCGARLTVDGARRVGRVVGGRGSPIGGKPGAMGLRLEIEWTAD